MIKLIIFDFGGVCMLPKDSKKNIPDLDRMVFFNISEKFSLPVGKVIQSMDKLLKDYQKGKLSDEGFKKAFSEEVGSKELGKISEEEWENLIVGPYDLEIVKNEELYEIVKKLKENGIEVALLSNTIPPHVKRTDKYGYFDVFDSRILSYEVGSRKPEKEIYEMALEKARSELKIEELKPGECVYVDDLPRYVRAAEKVGMVGILYQNPKQLVSDLRELGVDV